MEYEIRVNGIAPGPIVGTTGFSKLMPQDVKGKAEDLMPLYKVGTKWDVAMAALYLALPRMLVSSSCHFIIDSWKFFRTK